MIVVDSCGWIEYLADGNKADKYAGYFSNIEEIITPTIVIYEVYKKVMRNFGEEVAIMVAAQMNKTRVIDLTEQISLLAATISLKNNLPMADAIVYATAKVCECQVVTSDQHFITLDDVIFV